MSDGDNDTTNNTTNNNIVKHYEFKSSQNSITITYRKDKEGKPIATGFDVKQYGNEDADMMPKCDALIKYGIKRMHSDPN